MSDRAEDVDGLRRAIADAVGEPAGEHPDLDLLAGYFRGELDAAADDSVQEHLSVCPACAEAALAVADLVAATAEHAAEDAGEDRQEPADLAAAATWRRLQQELAATEPQPRPAFEPRPAGRRPPWQAAAAAVLAAATLGLALWNVQLQRHGRELERSLARLDRPQLNLPTVYLDPAGAERGGEAQGVDLAAGDAHLLLILTPEDLDAGEYALALRAWAEPAPTEDAEPLWSGEGLALSEYGTVRVLLPASWLPPGDYRLDLAALRGAARSDAGSYRLRIR